MPHPASLRSVPAVVATLALTGVAALTMSPAQAAPKPAAPTAQLNPSGNFLKLWTAEWMGKHDAYTAATATALAQRVDYIAAMKGKFSATLLPGMRAANPDLRLGVYRNATFGNAGMTEDLYAHDAGGNRIHAIKWPTTYLMQIDSPGWSSALNASCADLVARSGYDDCYLDVLGYGPLTSVYLNAKPVNKDGSLWTPNQWIAASSNLARNVKALTGEGVTGNGIGTGRRYWSTDMPSKPLIPATDQVAAEGFVRDAQSSVTAYRNEAEWKKDVDMLVDSEAAGKGMMTMTKLWITATPAQVDAWHEYTLATFLLGSGGKSKFFFLRSKADTGWMDHPFDLINPGTPLGGYRPEGGVYKRDFTTSLVLVNPTKVTATVPLTRTYTTLTGATVSGSVTLAPNTARILRF